MIFPPLRSCAGVGLTPSKNLSSLDRVSQLSGRASKELARAKTFSIIITDANSKTKIVSGNFQGVLKNRGVKIEVATSQPTSKG